MLSSCAAALGVASHLFLYIRGEWERDASIVALRYATFGMLMMAYMMEIRQQALDERRCPSEDLSRKNERDLEADVFPELRVRCMTRSRREHGVEN